MLQPHAREDQLSSLFDRCCIQWKRRSLGGGARNAGYGNDVVAGRAMKTEAHNYLDKSSLNAETLRERIQSAIDDANGPSSVE